MSKCIGGIAYDAASLLVTHKPSKKLWWLVWGEEGAAGVSSSRSSSFRAAEDTTYASGERGAIMDIRQSPDLSPDARIVFHDKKRRVTLINPDKSPDWKSPSDKHRKVKNIH